MDEIVRSRGVDICFDEDLLRNAPHCPHGPTLLFERHVVGKITPRKFYACSACRDRKQCSFFQWADEKRVEARIEHVMRPENSILQFSNEQCSIRLKTFKTKTERRFCRTCGVLLMLDEWSSHVTHVVQSDVTDDQLKRPTTLLRPLSNNKTNAQYLFTDKSADFLSRLILDQLHIRRVLCVGTPRLFEEIRARIVTQKKDRSVKCLLLDLDQRLSQFYGADEFCRYNMFNHHFFNDGRDVQDSSDVYRQFMSGVESDRDLLVVIDPPFGGLVEVISFTLRRITDDWKKTHDGGNEDMKYVVQTMWIFPYFMESRITECLPSFTMLDYRVDYDNHADFCSRSEGGSKNGSPVRVFTNVDPSVIVLPSEDGYSPAVVVNESSQAVPDVCVLPAKKRQCVPCGRYVSTENKHCTACNACTTKAGRTYVHCAMCRRCVKPSWTHCTDCGVCEIDGRHTATLAMTTGCHVCGESGHKRRDCPNRQPGNDLQSKQPPSCTKQKRSKKRKSINEAQDNRQRQSAPTEQTVKRPASKRSKRQRKD